jgi:ProP effector
MNQTTSAPASGKAENFSAARNLLKELETRFPVFKDTAPLAIGIDKQVIAAWPEVEKKFLRMALRSHTQSTRYLKAMEKAAQRLNLDGSAAAEVTAEQRDHASGLLRERFKKKAEEKRAAEAAALAENRRQEKLQQLTEKFGRKER